MYHGQQDRFEKVFVGIQGYCRFNRHRLHYLHCGYLHHRSYVDYCRRCRALVSLNMPTLHAGVNAVTDKPRVVSVTESQMRQLGFLDGKPQKVGCGSLACAYQASEKSDALVKITKDERDATAAYRFMRLPGGVPNWVVPIYAVYRLPENTFAICVARAEKLPKEWADPIDEIYFYTDDEDIEPDEWESVYKDIKKEIEYQEIERGATDEDKNIRRALELINNAVLAFRSLDLDWGDFHAYNWMMYAGKPVLIDLGLTAPLGNTKLPSLKEIPVLPF